MATRTVIQFIDDLDGTEANETVLFGLDGVQYEVDLSEGNAAKLREDLAAFVAAARKVGGRKIRVKASSKVTASSTTESTAAKPDASENQAIREWARQQGKHVSARGRLSAALVEEYRASRGAALPITGETVEQEAATATENPPQDTARAENQEQASETGGRSRRGRTAQPKEQQAEGGGTARSKRVRKPAATKA